MSTIIFEKIKKTEKKRQDMISTILKEKEIVRGSFCEIHVKCGKKNCHCYSGQGHSHKRMSLRENGISFSRAVPREDYEWIQKMTDNFREYRNMRRQLVKLEDEIQELLDQLENEIVNRCRIGKSYLNVSHSEAKPNKSSETKKNRNKKIVIN